MKLLDKLSAEAKKELLKEALNNKVESFNKIVDASKTLKNLHNYSDSNLNYLEETWRRLIDYNYDGRKPLNKEKIALLEAKYEDLVGEINKRNKRDEEETKHITEPIKYKAFEKKMLENLQKAEENKNDELMSLFELNCDDKDFIDVADAFDKMGCFEAADIIDNLAEHIMKKSTNSGRAYAKIIREIRKMAQPPNWMPAPLTQQQIPPPYQPAQQPIQGPVQGPDVSGLTKDQINSVNRIQNPGLRSQWINELKRRNMQQQRPVQQPQQPTPQQPQAPVAQPQPVQQVVQQPMPVVVPAPQPMARKPFNFEQWEKNISGQPTKEDEEIKQVYEGAEIKADDK